MTSYWIRGGEGRGVAGKPRDVASHEATKEMQDCMFYRSKLIFFVSR